MVKNTEPLVFFAKRTKVLERFLVSFKKKDCLSEDLIPTEGRRRRLKDNE